LGVLLRQPLAMRLSAVAFLCAAAAYLFMDFPNSGYQPWSDRLVNFVAVGVCASCAAYVWAFSRKTRVDLKRQ
jgi:hypothetical protein